MNVEELASIFEQVKIAPIQPQDVIVMRTSHHLSIAQAANIHKELESVFGEGRKILILEGGADVAIIRNEPEEVTTAGAPPGPVERHRSMSG